MNYEESSGSSALLPEERVLYTARHGRLSAVGFFPAPVVVATNKRFIITEGIGPWKSKSVLFHDKIASMDVKKGLMGASFTINSMAGPYASKTINFSKSSQALAVFSIASSQIMGKGRGDFVMPAIDLNKKRAVGLKRSPFQEQSQPARAKPIVMKPVVQQQQQMPQQPVAVVKPKTITNTFVQQQKPQQIMREREFRPILIKPVVPPQAMQTLQGLQIKLKPYAALVQKHGSIALSIAGEEFFNAVRKLAGVASNAYEARPRTLQEINLDVLKSSIYFLKDKGSAVARTAKTIVLTQSLTREMQNGGEMAAEIEGAHFADGAMFSLGNAGVRMGESTLVVQKTAGKEKKRHIGTGNSKLVPERDLKIFRVRSIRANHKAHEGRFRNLLNNLSNNK